MNQHRGSPALHPLGTRPSLPRPLFSVLLLLLCLALQQAVDMGDSTRLLNALQNYAHVPVFGAIALAVLWLMPCGWRHRSFKALLTAGAIGALSEAVQIPLARDASMEDWLRDLCGASAALLLWTVHGRTRPLGWRGAALALAAALVLAPAWELGTAGLLALERIRLFPVLYSGDSPLAEGLADANESAVTLSMRPSDWLSSGPARAARIVLLPAAYPGISLPDLRGDWSGYDSLDISIFVPGKDSLILVLRVHDARHNNDYSDRFNARLRLAPGATRLSVPIQFIALAPHGRRMDLRRVRGLSLFATDLTAPETLWVDRIGLLKGSSGQNAGR